MRNLLSKAAKYRAEARRRKLWQRVVSLLACVVVFITTYAQILPAITLEADLFEPDGHVHTDECYKIVKTEEKTELDCPLELHTHTAACYDADGALACGYADFVVHTHDSFCYDENGKLVCTLPEIEEHTHTALCYPVRVDEPADGTDSTGAAHVHTDECYTEIPGSLVCGEEETDGHTHTEDCYVETEQLVCELEESEGHTHTDLCMDAEKLPELCGQEETKGHTHDESCYETVRELVCEQEEAEPHTHTEDCYAPAEKELTCGFEESESEEKSEGMEETPDPFAGEDEDLRPICGQEEIELHTHTAACFGAGGAVVCGQLEVLEHQHTEDCFRVVQEASEEKVLDCAYTGSKDKADDEKPAGSSTGKDEEPADSSAGEDKDGEKPADSDSTGEKPANSGSEKPTDSGSTGEDKDKDGAESDGTGGETSDDETPAPGGDVDGDPDDEPILAPATLAERVLAAAESHIGYKEDTEDCDIDADGETRGLTQFGLHYGMPYEKWDAMFVAYCLEEAGAEELPSAADCLFDIDVWASMLDGAGYCQTAELYTPAPGDVAFFDLDGDGTLDHVAFVEKVTDTRLFVIAGDSSDCVRRASYARADESVVGYGVLPRDEDEGATDDDLTGEPSEDETEDDPAVSDPMDEPQDGEDDKAAEDDPDTTEEDSKTEEDDPDKTDEDGKTDEDEPDKAGEDDKTGGKDDDKKDEDTDQDSTQEAALGLAGRVLAAAQAEFGYTSAPDGTTLYRAFYDDPTAPLDVLFVAYCLDQAGIEGVPSAQDSGFDSEQWRAALAAAGMFRAAGAEEAVPAPGEVLFLDKDGDGAADFVAIVEKVAGGKVHVLEMAEAPAVAVAALALDTDEENGRETTASAAASCVRRVAYSLTDTQVLGYTALASLEDEDTTLTEEEQAQVDAVIALIDALPSQEEIEQTLTVFEEHDDEDTADAYLTELRTAAIAAYKAYEKLNEEQQQKVTNAEKLLALEALWSAEILDEPTAVERVIAMIDDLPTMAEVATHMEEIGEDEEARDAYLLVLEPQAKAAHMAFVSLPQNEKRHVNNLEKLKELEWLLHDVPPLGDVGDRLDGDYAYISELTIIKTIDGTWPFDDDNAPGNDQSEENGIVRSFDMLSYTLNIRNTVRDGAPYLYYKEGRLYFEFVLPVAATKAAFDTAKMTWLAAKPEATYTITNGTYNGSDAQFLRGSFLWQSGIENETAIGESYLELNIYLQVLAMTQGEELKPEFTFWLEGNEVPNNGPVTGSDHHCTLHEGEDYRTVAASPVTVSSTPRFNILLASGGRNVLGTFDFTTGNDKALNKTAGSNVQGRMVSYGIALQIYGKSADHGMRGCELPDGNAITFDLEISSTYTYSDGQGSHTEDSATNGYTPLIWSAGGNQTNATKEDGRTVSGTAGAYASNVPGNTGNNYGKCQNGGTWSFELSNDGQTLHVTVSNYGIDLSRSDPFPYAYLNSRVNDYSFYNPNTISGYWDIQRACFSAGELWIVQPFNDANGESAAEKFASGSFRMSVKDTNLQMAGQTQSLSQVTDNGNQMNTGDDQVNIGVALETPGTIDYDIAFKKTNPAFWNDPLAEGCWLDGKDWVVAGGEMAIFDWIIHRSEGEQRGVAYDQFIKFDPDFFTPESVTGSTPASGMKVTVGYAAVAASPQTGWNHNGKDPNEDGYDEAMIYATADDMIFFNSLADLQKMGYVCVGVLFEFRGVCNSNEFHSDRTVKGYATTNTALAGKVFMVTHAASVWTKADLKDEVAAYAVTHGKDVDDELTDADYDTYLEQAFPSRLGTNAGQQIRYADYPAWPNNYWNEGVNGTNKDISASYQNYKKSQYSETGWEKGTSGTDYGDSCLLVGYTMEIDKSVTQKTAASGALKTTYSIDDGQRIADFQLVGSSNIGTKNLDPGSQSTVETIVYIEDTIPAGLTYIAGSSYYGGTYRQTAEGRQGIVEDGTPIEPTEITSNADGTTTLRYELKNVTLDMNQKTTLPPIYYSCSIGDTVNILNDVQDGQKLVGSAKIWSTEDCLRPYLTGNGNLTLYEINVSKLNLGNISKIADQVYVDMGSTMGFTMAIGNSGANPRNVVALDVIPYHNGDGTFFKKGSDCVSQVTELSLKKNTENVNLAGFRVYYSTATGVREQTSDDYKNKDHSSLIDAGWRQLTLNSATGELTWPDVVGDFEPTGILVIGALDPGQTLGIHLTMRLTNDSPEDCVVNHLYESGGSEAAGLLKAQATTYIVGRTLEGLTWLDDNANGIQDDKEIRLSGVTVSLLKLKEGGDPKVESDYEQYYYQGSSTKPEAVIIETGQTVSVRASSSRDATKYGENEDAQGRYKFTDLPAGTFAVKFTDSTGNVITSEMLASPANKGPDDTKDSDGIATCEGTGNDEVLKQTMILGIEMPVAERLPSVLYESKYHDSGFYYKRYELPSTGGAGTQIYYVFGGVALMAAALLYAGRRKRKGGM